jgi:catechol 2,3-dioxygenase-like lactoylglutathione lyase family enzyme
MKYNFHHIHLLCSDLDNTISWFTDNLGANLVLKKKFGTADGATLDLNDTMINLRVSADHESVNADASQPTYGYHHICVSVDDIDAAHQELTGKGVTFIADPMDTPDARIAFFRGPDNIVIEVLQRR